MGEGWGPGPDPNNPYSTPPTTQELVLRGLGSALQGIGQGPSRRLSGQLIRGGASALGGVSGVYGDAMREQRLDPLSRQLLLNQAIANAAQGITVPVSPATGPTTAPFPAAAADDFYQGGTAEPTLTIPGQPAVTRAPRSQAELIANARSDKERALLLTGGDLARFVPPFHPGQIDPSKPTIDMFTGDVIRPGTDPYTIEQAKTLAATVPVGSHIPAVGPGGVHVNIPTGEVRHPGWAEVAPTVSAELLAQNPGIDMRQAPPTGAVMQKALDAAHQKNPPALTEQDGYALLAKVKNNQPFNKRELAQLGTEDQNIAKRIVTDAQAFKRQNMVDNKTAITVAVNGLNESKPLDRKEAGLWVTSSGDTIPQSQVIGKKASDMPDDAVRVPNANVAAQVRVAKGYVAITKEIDALAPKILKRYGENGLKQIWDVQTNRIRLAGARGAGDPELQRFESLLNDAVISQPQALGIPGSREGNNLISRVQAGAASLRSTVESAKAANAANVFAVNQRWLPMGIDITKGKGGGIPAPNALPGSPQAMSDKELLDALKK